VRQQAERAGIQVVNGGAIGSTARLIAPAANCSHSDHRRDSTRSRRKRYVHLTKAAAKELNGLPAGGALAIQSLTGDVPLSWADGTAFCPAQSRDQRAAAAIDNQTVRLP
jgi:hypothetical protein